MNIYLVGYRGTGKTSLGRLLGIQLKRLFLDTDELIVEKAGKSIPDIFKDSGEDYFRKLESDILKELSERDDLIVATGGGIVIKEENRAILKSSPYTIYLTASPEVIFERIGGDKNRPALTDKSEMDEIKAVIELRQKWYEEVGKIKIDTEKNNPVQCLEQLMLKFKDMEGKK